MTARNLLTNGSFEKRHGWTYPDSSSKLLNFSPGVYADGNREIVGYDQAYGLGYAAPSEGSKAFYTEWDGAPGDLVLSQTANLQHTRSDVLSFDYEAGWDLKDYGAKANRTFTVEIRDLTTGAVSHTTVLTALAGQFISDTGLQHFSLDLSAFRGDQVSVSLVWTIPDNFDGPAICMVDNVQLLGSAAKSPQTLTGGQGGDVLTGHGGADTFVFTSLADSRGAGVDVITDLRHDDVIDLHAIDADPSAAGDQAFVRVHAFDGGRGEMTLIYDRQTGQTTLSLDVDGDRHADMTVLIDGRHTGFDHFVF